jgi:hypothetical protein
MKLSRTQCEIERKELSGRADSIKELTNVTITNRFHFEYTVSLGDAVERLKECFQQSKDLVRIAHRRPRREPRDVTNFVAEEMSAFVLACPSRIKTVDD